MYSFFSLCDLWESDWYSSISIAISWLWWKFNVQVGSWCEMKISLETHLMFLFGVQMCAYEEDLPHFHIMIKTCEFLAL